MMLRFLIACLLLLPASGLAQVAPLPLPAPSVYRAASGAPGEHYWQQRVDYRIDAALDPASHRIEGSTTIRYTNNSPHTLDYLWLQLDQNLFSPTSQGARVHGPDSRWRGAFEEGGLEISHLTVSVAESLATPAPIVDDTRMRIDLPRPVPPRGGIAEVVVDFAFTVPEHGADRMGRLDLAGGPLYQIAQWYPRLAVYDDVEGWNTLPYLGQGEFYLEYGDFEVSLTLPSDFIAVATGELLNPEEVYTPEQAERLHQARLSDTTLPIVVAGDERPRSDGLLTWRFRAENVRDVAWAASPAFLLDGAGWNGVLLLSAYPEEGLGTTANPGWERATDYLRFALQHHSDRWHAYPYPTAINVAGRVRGMEYPMMLFCALDDRGEDLFGVTDHEIAHAWFPMMVGSDERRYPWMDEGLATFMNAFSNRAYYGDSASRLAALHPETIAAQMATGTQTSMTPADQVPRTELGFLAYRKPAFALLLLRDHILGPDRFDAAFRDYLLRWAYRHPQPADFFRTIEDAAGEELDWFWHGWFFSHLPFDASLAREADGTLALSLANNILLPVDLHLTYANGSTQSLHIPVDGFLNGGRVLITPDRPDLTAAEIDPDDRLPDINRSDNRWPR